MTPRLHTAFILGLFLVSCASPQNDWPQNVEPLQVGQTEEVSVDVFESPYDPNVITLEVEETSLVWPADPIEAAQYSLLLFQDLLGIENPQEAYLTFEVEEHEDYISVTADQYFEGVPVFNASLSFKFKYEGTLISIYANYLEVSSSTETTPDLSEKEAFELAKDFFEEDEKGSDFTLDAAELVIYDAANDWENPVDEVLLVWDLDLGPTEDWQVAQHVKVDAETGDFYDWWGSYAD